MTGTDSLFVGSMPQLYDHHLGALLFEAYATDIAQRLARLATDRVLETAAGTGIVTQALTAALPETVEIVATDLNQPMLDHAATKPGMARVRFQQADALALPFPDQSFGAVVCQFGIMFFPDRVAGMREARRVLKPGGHFLFNVWDSPEDNPIVAATVAALAKRHPAHPSWFLERTPHGYRDPDRIRADLASAGFRQVSVETVRATGRARDASDPAIGFCQGSPLRAEIETLEPDGLAQATAAVAAALATQFGDASFTVPLQALVIEATA